MELVQLKSSKKKNKKNVLLRYKTCIYLTCTFSSAITDERGIWPQCHAVCQSWGSVEFPGVKRGGGAQLFSLAPQAVKYSVAGSQQAASPQPLTAGVTAWQAQYCWWPPQCSRIGHFAPRRGCRRTGCQRVASSRPDRARISTTLTDFCHASAWRWWGTRLCLVISLCSDVFSLLHVFSWCSLSDLLRALSTAVTSPLIFSTVHYLVFKSFFIFYLFERHPLHEQQQFRYASVQLQAHITAVFSTVRIAGWTDMDSGSRAAMVGDGAANFTSAHLWLDLLNTSSPPTRWDSSSPAEGTGLDEQQQRLIREQAYRDFTTTIQVFILIGSLLGECLHAEETKHACNPACKQARLKKPRWWNWAHCMCHM